MERPTELPPSADPLGEALHLLRLTGCVYAKSELTSPWGVDLPPLEGHMMFHIVTAGRCWLEADGIEPVPLERGSLALVPHGLGHQLVSEPGGASKDFFDLPIERVTERYERLEWGGGGEFCRLICVVVRFDHAAAHRLIDALPPVLHVDAWHGGEDRWLSDTLRFIAREAEDLRPGGETVITRLADILVIQVVRRWIEEDRSATSGWLAALRDEQLGRAIAAIHRAPGQDWTLESLARKAAMSRSAFAARFTAVVGESVPDSLATSDGSRGATRTQRPDRPGGRGIWLPLGSGVLQGIQAGVQRVARCRSKGLAAAPPVCLTRTVRCEWLRGPAGAGECSVWADGCFR